jgi:hypothetical protein
MAGLFPRITASQLLGLCWLSAVGCFLMMVLLLITLAQGSGATVRYDDPFGRGFEYVPFANKEDLYGPIDELWLS